MTFAVRTTVSILCLTSATAIAAGEALSPQGYGQVRFGMKVRDVEAVLNQRTTEPYNQVGCDYAEFKKYPGLRFMVEDGVVTRADAREGVKNSANVIVGMTLKRIQARYPMARIEPHKYDDEGHYIILSSKDGGSAIVFEESKGRVTYVRAGRKPSVEYVEGCL